MTGAVQLARPADGVAVVTFNRPDRRNAVNAEFIADFDAILRELSGSESDRVVILTGAGKGFCAGMDQRESGYEDRTGAGAIGGLLSAQREIGELVPRIRTLPQPIIAAVNGAAVGAGLGFALAADIRIASESAFFSVGAIRIGLSGADMGMTWHLPRIVGTTRAADWLLTGRAVGAPEAAASGLVTSTVPDDELLLTARETADLILANQDFAVRLTKRALWSNVTVADLPTALELENQAQVLAAARLIQLSEASAK